MWGYSNLQEMLLEKPLIVDYWHETEIHNVINCSSIVKKQGKFETHAPYKAIKKDGDIILVKFNASLIKDERGEPIAVTGSFFDITEEVRIKKEIEEYDKKLNLLLNNIDEVVYGIEPSFGCQLDGKIFFLSGKAKTLFGFDLQDSHLNQDIWRECLHPEDIQVLMDSTSLAVKEKRTITREYRMKNKISGNYAWFEDKVTPQFDSKGELMAYFGSSRDITEKKNTNDLLKESEEKYRLISDNNNDLITLRNEKGNPLFVSNSIKSLLGYTSEEYLNLNLIDLIHPIDKESAKKLTANSLFKFKAANTTEARIKHKDGHYIWMQAVSNPIYDENGDIKHIVGSSRDITERKKLEFILIENEEKYRSLFENALVGIFSYNHITQKAINVNSVCINILGYDTKQDFLNNFNAIYLFANEVDQNSLMFEIEESGQIVDQIIKLNKKDRSFFWGRISLRLIADEGTIEGVIVDVTQRKIYEEQLKKNLVEKDLLLKEIHHRVKNNLQIISSLLKLQQNKLDDPKLGEPLFESRERIRAIALIHEKLYLSNDISTINFSDYLMNLTRPMYVLNKEKKINVTFNLEEYFTDINVAIPLGLTCYEIISNAYKHAFKIKNSNNINIIITKSKSNHELIISDNGDGFNINSIDISKSLGWNLINNLIKQINGTITIHSKIGVGSEFKIALNNGPK
jgi:PAS domain S-box-containing protein